ncbi:hypothetical protein C2G38_320289 [Gigaspora rosea]|uniref:trimethyllysine dioxygenase n=1 Tax=Gigaspora rosea TaxID=44941 RepID=A0A397W465_9GLOM|nr:hypothetical protein C2G38_320289 [Gigaspora rosea]
MLCRSLGFKFTSHIKKIKPERCLGTAYNKYFNNKYFKSIEPHIVKTRNLFYLPSNLVFNQYKNDLCQVPLIKSFSNNLNKTYLRNFIKISDTEDAITVSTTTSKVIVDWQDNQTSKFHNIWLRDHCKCSECYHQITKQRLLDTFSIPEDIKAISTSPGPEGIEIKWNDEHKSFFKWGWLRRHSYDPKFIDNQKILNIRKTLWNAGIKDCPPIVQYIDVMNTKEGLASLLKNISEFGFCFIDDVPHAVKETEELAKRICFIRETHYDLEHGDTAYTTLPLRAHTDNTYFTDPSGLQMFHLIEFDGKGGSSLLVDGFYVARQLRTKSPTAYETLSTITIPTHSAGDPNTLIQPTPNGYPILNHDPLLNNSLYQIRYNNDDRSTMNHLESEQVLEFYDALRKWNSLLKDKHNEYWFQLKPGRVVIFDNWRVLHGRDKFSGHRRLIGCYLNWDDYQSRLKISHLSQKEILESL